MKWIMSIIFAMLFTSVNATTLTVCSSGCGYTSIAAAIAAASSGDTIIVTGTFTENDLNISKNLVIRGKGQALSIIQGAASRGIATHRVFRITGNVTISDLTIRYGLESTGINDPAGLVSSGGGACVGAPGTLTLNNVLLSQNDNNYGGGTGGALYAQTGATIYLNACTLDNNKQTNMGTAGALYVDGTVVARATTFSNNVAASFGGVLSFSASGVGSFYNCTFSGNSVVSGSSGVCQSGGAIPAFYNCTFKNNTATATGGAMRCAGVTLTNCTFYGNSAPTAGGAVCRNTGSTANLTKIVNCTFYNNSSSSGADFANLGGGSGGCSVYMANTVMTNAASGSGNNFNLTTASTLVTNSNNYVASSNTGTFLTSGANLSGTLTNNGGPTETIAISSTTSTLYNAGTTSATGLTIPTKDQRGYYSGGTPDIGAYEYGATQNLSISYTALGNTSPTGSRNFTATISDISGVPTSGSLLPRVYYNKNSGLWFSTAATFVSGSTYSFTIDNTLMGNVQAGDQVNYFVVAQDNSTGAIVQSSPSGVIAGDVNGIGTTPSSANSYTITSAADITVSSLSGSSPYCAGASVTINYTATGTYTTGNTFTAQLSNASGSFASPVTLGSVTATASGSISGTIPSSTSTGTGYRVRVISSTPVVTGTDNGSNLSITALPSTPTISAGSATSFCSGGSVTLTSSSSSGNQWYLNSNPIGSATSNTYTANASGAYTVVVTTNGCSSSASFSTTVTVNNLPTTPTITAGGPTTFCAGGSVTLTSSVPTNKIGGGINYTMNIPIGGYKWYKDGNLIGTATSQTYTATTNGSYTVIVVNSSNCSSPASAATVVTVNPVPSTPTITAGSTTTFCSGGTVTLTSSSATDNQWYMDGSPIGSANGNTYNATTSGSYTVLVTTNSCPSAASSATTVTVNSIPSTPTITAGSATTFCSGGNVTLTSSSATGNQWYLNSNAIGGATSNTYTTNTSGSYTVVVTTNGCSSSASAGKTVTVNNLPATPTITAGGPTTFCAGGSVTLSSSVPTNKIGGGGINYTINFAGGGYKWYKDGNLITGATSQSYNVTTSGSYTVIVTNISNCTSSESAATVVTVNPVPSTPTITAGSTTTFCSGGSVSLTCSSATGNQWYKDGSPTGSANGNTYNATASGNYTVVVTTNSCPSAASSATTVTVNPLPSTPTVSSGSTTTFCAGSSVTLTSSSASGNQWYLDGSPMGVATSNTYIATASGSYTVVVTANGCSSAVSSATTVTVNPVPSAPTATAGGPVVLCGSATVTLSSSSASGNQWYVDGGVISGATAQSFTASAPGSYTVVTTQSGCSSPASNSVILSAGSVSTPVVTASGSTIFCTGGSVTFNTGSASAYQWYKDGVAIGSANNQTYIASVAGSYKVTATYGTCGSATSASQTVVVTTTNTWIGTTSDWNTASNWSCGVVPNSSTDDATIGTLSGITPSLSAAVSVRTLDLQGTNTVNLNGNQLTLYGQITGSGLIKGTSASSLVVSGATVTLKFSTYAPYLGDLTLTNNATVTLAAGLGVYGTITVGAGSVLNSGGYLNLKSNLYTTGRVAPLTTGTITGNVVVERYISRTAWQAWRLLSVPTKGTQTIRQSWQENQSPMIIGTNGFGTLIGQVSGTGFDYVAVASVASSIKTWTPTTATWDVTVTSTNNAIQTIGGYLLYVKGDRSVTPGMSTNTTNETVLRTTGALYMGNQTSSTVPANKYAVIGNIYPSAIDFTSLTMDTTTGFYNTFYLWDPKLYGASGAGAYQTFSKANGWMPSPGGGSYPVGTPNTVIQQGQAFLVVAKSAGGTIRFTESAKVNNNANVFTRTNQVTRLRAVLAIKGSEAPADGNTVVFGSGYSENIPKPANMDENFAISAEGTLASVSARAKDAQEGDRIDYVINHMKPGQSYVLEFNAENFSDQPAFLEDSYLHTITPLDMAGKTTVTFTANSSTNGRFAVVFGKAKSSPAITLAEGKITVAPNPVTAREMNLQFTNKPKGTYYVTFTNAVGQTIYTTTVNHSGNTSTQKIVLLKQAQGLNSMQITAPDGKTESQTIIINN